MAKPTYEELLEVVSELRRLLAERDRQIAELEGLVEELRRSGKRPAAPFSKGEPKGKPKRPDRKPGKKYGNQAVRLAPKRVGETIVVCCELYCDGGLELEGIPPGLCRALQRPARKAQPTYESLVEKIRGSPVVYPDETGWKQGDRI